MAASAGGMVFFKSVVDLVRALDRGALAPQDQVFVPADVLGADEEWDWEPLHRRILSAGAILQPLHGLRRICILSLRELNEGTHPPIPGAG